MQRIPMSQKSPFGVTLLILIVSKGTYAVSAGAANSLNMRRKFIGIDTQAFSNCKTMNADSSPKVTFRLRKSSHPHPLPSMNSRDVAVVVHFRAWTPIMILTA